MDSKDLKKMFEVIVSLEPLNLRSLKPDNFEEEKFTKDTDNSTLTFKPRKPSLPLSLATSSRRRGSIDPRKSLFQNDSNRSNSNLNKLSLFRANSKSLPKINQEMSFSEINDVEILQYQNIPRHADDRNVYEKVSISILLEETKRNSEDIETNSDKRDTITSIFIEPPLPHGILYRNSLELLRSKELRHSNLSENACHNRSVENKANPYIALQSAPQSGRTSIMNPLSCFKDNQSSIDSGVDQTIPINLQSFMSNEATNSSESFSDISESNVTTCLENDLSFFNNESPATHNMLNTSAIYSENTNPPETREEIFQRKITPVIQSEEEQNMFFRMISNELSLNSLTTKEIIKFHMRNGTFSSQIMDKFQTAISVCHTLKTKFGIAEETFCQIVEIISKESLERPLEDHENILEIFYSWGTENCCNRFIFQENIEMYKIFMEPSMFINEIKRDFEINDSMWIKAKSSKWIRAMCSITDSSIYYTVKQNFKDQNDLSLLANLKDVDVYTCFDNKKIKKEYKAPTMNLIILKGRKLDHQPLSHAYLAALDQIQKEKWIEAIKVAKYSFSQLKNNYLECQMVFSMGFRSQANSGATIGESLNHTEPYSF